MYKFNELNNDHLYAESECEKINVEQKLEWRVLVFISN